nr:putative transmembrane protein [Toxoplasma gondii TgCATBr9]
MRERYREESSSHLFDGGYIPSPTLRTFACFYANEADPQGLPVAEVVFVMDSRDAAIIVLFVLSLVMGVPICCGISFSCHTLKHRRLRRALRRLRLVQQRDAIELHLMQELGVAPHLEEEDEEEEEEEEAGHYQQTAKAGDASKAQTHAAVR